MIDPRQLTSVTVQEVTAWLRNDSPAWATATRHHARVHERDGVVVIFARATGGMVGYAVFDRQISHLHYIETRKDCRRRGVASRTWARIREEAGPGDLGVFPNTDDKLVE